MSRPSNADPLIASIVAGFPLRPIPAPSVRPWAGLRLGDADANVGEMWLAGPDALVATAGDAQVSLDALAAAAGVALVGEAGMRLLGPRFPLIVKLIDAAEWLSLQVHPSDELASALYGEGALGKTEAWLVLDAEPGVDLITGPGRTLAEGDLRAAIADGTLGRDRCEVRPAMPGDTLLVEAGTLHAIGAGAFVYEIEQPSDLTFRVSDWGRPSVPGRSLHPAESLRALRAEAHAIPVGRSWQLDGGALAVREFRFEIADLPGPVERRPRGRSLEVVTVIEGTAQVSGDGWSERLARWETLIVPASAAAYRIEGIAAGRLCIGSVP